MGFVDDQVFFFGPRALLDLGVQVVVPALATLFPQPALEFLGNHAPLFGAIFAHEFHHLHRDKTEKLLESLALFPIIKSLFTFLFTFLEEISFPFVLPFNLHHLNLIKQGTRYLLCFQGNCNCTVVSIVCVLAKATSLLVEQVKRKHPYQLVLIFGPEALDQNGVYVLPPAVHTHAFCPPLCHSDMMCVTMKRVHYYYLLHLKCHIATVTVCTK